MEPVGSGGPARDAVRVVGLGPERFLAEYLRPGVPVVVAGEVDRWTASSRWSWAWLAERFGDRTVDVCDDWFDPTATMTLAEFVRSRAGDEGDRATSYVRWFSRHRDGPGRWADDVFDVLARDWRQPAFLPVRDYLVPFTAPGERVDAARDRFPYRGLFLSDRGARTRLHRDPWMGGAALCQVAGSKWFRLYAPGQEAALVAAAVAGDPAAERVTPAAAGPLDAGEVLYIPDGWWHQVDTTTPSISLTWNFVHRATSSRFSAYVRESPTDPELAVVEHFLSGRVPGTSATSAAELVPAAIAAG